MRAVVLEGERRVGVHDVAELTLFDPRSAIVEVDQASICGSDLHFYWGEFSDPFGIRPGHEFIGTVAEEYLGCPEDPRSSRSIETCPCGR